MKNEQILPVAGDVLITDKALSSNFIFVNSADGIDFVSSNVYKLLLNKNQSFPTPREFTPGIDYKIIIIQDNVGGRILTFDTDYFIFLGGDLNVINTAPNSVSILNLNSDGRIFYCDVVSSINSQYKMFTDTSTNLKFRNGVRNSSFVIDKELTPTGFSGTEGVDWENIGSGVYLSIAYTPAIPFNTLLNDMGTHTMIADITFTVDSAGAIDNACTSVLLVNNVSYTPDLTAFHVVGIYDNTLAYTLLSFTLKRGLYIVSILNFD